MKNKTQKKIARNKRPTILAQVKKLHFEKGDLLVVTVKGDTTPHQLARVRAYVVEHITPTLFDKLDPSSPSIIVTSDRVKWEVVVREKYLAAQSLHPL